jgi:putative membrane protein
LLRYYLLVSLAWGPLFPIIATIRFLRYRTIRYHFDAEGVTMRWGGLIRREVSLAYSRIQDIHLSSGLIERWLKLARIEIQTASGGNQAELTLEGLLEYRLIRDFLYARMRGSDDRHPATTASPSGHTAMLDAETLHALTASLQQTAEELRAIRIALHPVTTSSKDIVV